MWPFTSAPKCKKELKREHIQARVVSKPSSFLPLYPVIPPLSILYELLTLMPNLSSFDITDCLLSQVRRRLPQLHLRLWVHQVQVQARLG
jgi:hypothetical protein